MDACYAWPMSRFYYFIRVLSFTFGAVLMSSFFTLGPCYFFMLLFYVLHIRLPVFYTLVCVLYYCLCYILLSVLKTLVRVQYACLCSILLSMFNTLVRVLYSCLCSILLSVLYSCLFCNHVCSFISSDLYSCVFYTHVCSIISNINCFWCSKLFNVVPCYFLL